jgi:ubiquinone/menaquinone biosynthesis C-methylase UbiE
MSDPGFKDHFSRLAAGYSRYRPAYPAELIEHVASFAPSRSLAIDCATGSGQAAVALAAHFSQVIAVDGSASQLANAQPHERVRYVCALAEKLPVADHSAVLVTAAQAVHWFDFERFNAECRRVLVAGGVVAVWTYEKFRATPELDAVMDRFYYDVIGPFWPAERRYVDEEYRTLPFPWREEPARPFALTTDWILEQALGYVATWSAVLRYRDANSGLDPIPVLRQQLLPLWPAGSTRRLVWPVHLRVGRT